LRQRCSTGRSPSPGRPSQGSTASRSAPSGVAATSVRRTLRVVRATARCSAVRPPNGPKTARQLPQASSPSQGSGLHALPGHAWPGRPSWGFPPLQRRQRRDPYHPGMPRPAPSVLGVSHPLDGLLSLRPCGHARSAAAHGVLAVEALSDSGAVARCRARCVLSSAVLCNLEPFGHEVESAAVSNTLEPACPGPTAVVPEPRSPLRSTPSQDRRKSFRPRFPLTQPSPRRLGEP
jgi:hypothetical protein